jgi:hypothetical protein
MVRQANDCFWSEFEKSRDLRFAAEKAVRENVQQPPPEAVKAAVLDYVNSRTELKKCMAKLQAAPLLAAASEEDRKAIEAQLELMRMNYLPQARFELAVLIGLIDKQAGAEELAHPDP